MALALAAGSAPILAIIAPLGMAALTTVLAVALLVAAPRRILAAARDLRAIAIAVAGVTLWGALSTSWSITPAHSLFESGRFLLLSITGLMIMAAAGSLDAAGRQRVGNALIGGVAVAIVLLQIERWTQGGIVTLLGLARPDAPVTLSRFDRGAVVLMLMAWPTAAILAHRRTWTWLAIGAVAMLATLFELNSHAAMLGAVLGIVAVPIAWFLPRPAAGVMIASVALLGLVGPRLVPDGDGIAWLQRSPSPLHPSAIHRLAIWRFTAERIDERPWFGWGLDASRALPGGHDRVIDAMPDVKLPDFAELLPLHPHCAALQWRVELGLPGVLLCVLAIGVILWPLAKSRAAARGEKAIALALAASALTIALLSYGAWQAWWIASLWLVAATLRAVSSER